VVFVNGTFLTRKILTFRLISHPNSTFTFEKMKKHLQILTNRSK
jgi:hypothetical protein